jgi:UDP-N-acetylglucosamine 2-epimerase (non-hydrolysing)
MQVKTIHIIAAARPNFMKVAPLYHALKNERWCSTVLIHTGQHYDVNMSDSFFSDLCLPAPDIHLGVGSDTHAKQTAGVMVAYEKICIEKQPDFVVVVGDVNSTMACTLVAKKMNLHVGHLEAGLRSGDRTMPEEINRIVTDSLSDVLWTPSLDADNNLIREGIPAERIVRVGNIMIDSYEMLKERIDAEDMPVKMELDRKSYGVVTLHRPSNVDTKSRLKTLVSALVDISKYLPLVFPVHPRTQKMLKDFKLWEEIEKAVAIYLLEPLGYIHFMSLVKDAKLLMTDSGGIQEETSYLNTPCLTLRETTERPITITQGTNRLVSPIELETCVQEILSGEWPQALCPEYWDGFTAGRVAKSMYGYLTK